MKVTLKLIVLGLILTAGCKDKETIDPNTAIDKEATIEYSPGDSYTNTSSEIKASFDGSFIINFSAALNNETTIQKSTDGGSTWTAVNAAQLPSQSEGWHINNAGYFAGNSQSQSSVISLKSNSPILLNISGNYKTYFLGKDDYIYCHIWAGLGSPGVLVGGKGSQSKIDTLSAKMDTLGIYAGQDQNGGVSFINTATQRFSTHNPTTGAWETRPCNYDKTRITVPFKLRGFGVKYNGYDKVVIADGYNYVVVDLTTNTPTYGTFLAGYMASTHNWISTVDINKKGEVFATMYNPNNTSSPGVYVKYAPNEEVMLDVISKVHCSGEYTYIMSHNKALKIGQTELNMTGIMKPKKAWGASTITPTHIYFIESSDNISLQTFYTMNRSTKVISSQNIETAGNISGFKYIYSADGKIFISGDYGSALSLDKGETWEAISGTPKSVVSIRKINGTYYGQSVFSYTYYIPGTGFSSVKSNTEIFTSTDLKNWTSMPGTAKTGEDGVGALRSDGFMYKIVNTNPQGNQVLVGYVSRDFGVTYTVTDPSEIDYKASTPLSDEERFRYIDVVKNKRTIALLDEWGEITKTVTFTIPINPDPTPTELNQGATSNVKIGNDLYFLSDRVYKLSF